MGKETVYRRINPRGAAITVRIRIRPDNARTSAIPGTTGTTTAKPGKTRDNPSTIKAIPKYLSPP